MRPSCTGLLFHNAEFQTVLDEKCRNARNILKRVNSCALSVTIDVTNDDRSPWFFKGLSPSLVNQVLQILSAHSEEPYRGTLDDEALMEEMVPFDDMPFKVDASGEELHVVYSIKSLRSQFRKSIIGPQGVNLYESDIPHFGPIYVYKCKEKETLDELGELSIVRQMCSIESPINDVLNTLCELNFGA